MSFVVPCRRDENDPDDWFIGRDGRQHADDPILTEDEIREVAEQCDSLEEATEAIEIATDEKVRQALIRRRKARDKCHVDCILRLHCLDAGLEDPHGTWGGYYEEERRQIVKLRDQRRAERALRGGGTE